MGSPKPVAAWAVELFRVNAEWSAKRRREVRVRVLALVVEYDCGARDIEEARIVERTVTLGALSDTTKPDEDTSLDAKELAAIRLAVELHANSYPQGAVRDLELVQEWCRECQGQGGEEDADEDGRCWLRCLACEGKGNVEVLEEGWAQ